jgi:hypothetical protein
MFSETHLLEQEDLLMKRFILLLTVAVLVMLMAVPAIARPRTGTLGVGTYVVQFDSNGYKDNFIGLGFSASTAISRNMVVRGVIYATEHEDMDDFTAVGVDAQLLFGKNLIRPGFKLYAGLDYFMETLELDLGEWGSDEEDYSGLGLILGLGYNFRNMSIDWYGCARNPDAYDGFDLDTVGAGSLMISMRF